MLFDLAYLIVNADGTEHVMEQMLIEELERRPERKGTVDIEARTDHLAPIMEERSDAVRARADELAEEVAQQAGERTQEVGDRYLDLLRDFIVADADVHGTEAELFDLLADRWDVNQTLPGA